MSKHKELNLNYDARVLFNLEYALKMQLNIWDL